MSKEMKTLTINSETFTIADPNVPDWAKQPNKPTYTASEVGALPDTTEIPTVPDNVSEFNNDAGYLTAVPSGYVTEAELAAKGYLTEHQSLAGYAKTADLGDLATKDTIGKTDLDSDVQTSLDNADTALQSYTETDPTVPDWAKQPEKPSYTADEVGAVSQDGLGEAVNQALAAAKAAGEFDGKDGNPGKTAFEYAQDGGYAGTAEEFAAKLADGTTQAYVDDKIADLKAQGVQQVPLYAESVEWLDANGDKTKLYVLPDGYIYHYDKKSEEVETTVTVPAKAAVIDGKRYSHSSAAFVDNAGGSCIVVPIDYSAGAFEIAVTGITLTTSTYMGTTNTAFPGNVASTMANNKITITDSAVLNNIAYNKYRFVVLRCTSPYASGATLTYNGVEIELVQSDSSTVAAHATTTTTTETVVTDGFVSTGRAFVPADYEDRIVELEATAETVKKNTQRISKLESAVGNADGEANLANYLNSVHCPVQIPANGDDGADFDLHTFADFGDGFHSYFDDLVGKYPNYLVREYLGKDESESLDMYRYVLGKHYYSAWCKENYPRMYAWKNGSTIVYSVSIAPRIGDTMYSTAYVGTAYATVTAVSATNRTRTANGIAFVRYAEGDIEPTVCYTPAYNPFNRLVNANGELVIGISAIDGDVLTDVNGKTYKRYSFGDLKKDGTQPVHMTIIANEHGGDTEPGIPAVVTARLIRDLCSGQLSSDNPVYRYLRDNVQLAVIPAVNPHGLNKFPAGAWDGYHNANNVNINRNYDTPGWDVYWNENPDEQYRMGDYPGSENETQYVMNTMADSKAVVAMSVHTISCLVTGYKSRCMYQGQNPDGGYTQTKIDEIADDMKASYNLDFVAYDPLECPPETTSKSPSFITQMRSDMLTASS